MFSEHLVRCSSSLAGLELVAGEEESISPQSNEGKTSRCHSQVVLAWTWVTLCGGQAVSEILCQVFALHCSLLLLLLHGLTIRLLLQLSRVLYRLWCCRLLFSGSLGITSSPSHGMADPPRCSARNSHRSGIRCNLSHDTWTLRLRDGSGDRGVSLLLLSGSGSTLGRRCRGWSRPCSWCRPRCWSSTTSAAAS